MRRQTLKIAERKGHVSIPVARLSLFSEAVVNALRTIDPRSGPGNTTFLIPFDRFDGEILPLLEADAEISLRNRAPRLYRLLEERAKAGVERETALADAATMHRHRIDDLGFFDLMALAFDSLSRQRSTPCPNTIPRRTSQLTASKTA